MNLNILVFLGSSRESTPPYPSRLGARVANALVTQINKGDTTATLVDPLDFEFDQVFKPHFCYKKGKAPQLLDELANAIDNADAYVMVSPEYNHSMSPTLAHLLNHFGSSLFSYKPSLIATYSAGQWGGARAAVNMRSYLSELGCLPVSAMIHVPKAQEVFDENGEYLEDVDAKAWSSYIDRAAIQLNWWADASRTQRNNPNAIKAPSAFTKEPSQRNAP